MSIANGVLLTAMIGGAGAFAALAYVASKPLYATCDLVADQIVPTFADNAIRPIRVFNVEPGSTQGNQLTCSADAWFSNGAELSVAFTWTRVDGREFVRLEER
jgi:hypothetical protein